MTDIDSLTFAELKQIAAMFATTPAQTFNIKPAPTEERPVLVTTAHRGVFFGYAKDVSGDVIKLRAARNVVYWSADVQGFLGLAATGPSKTCRIGKAADIELRAITCVASVTPEAESSFESAPWGK